MARTRASVGAKVSVSKSSKARCSIAPTPMPSSSGTQGKSDRSSKSHSGGNPVCPRETPKWQKPITNFFTNKDEPSKGDDEVDVEDDETAGSSKPKKTNVIESDDEEDVLSETPKNSVLDESIHLEPLTGEDSHKMEEYFPKGTKGKGVGKKSKGKENRRDSKREREGEEIENASKRIKVN